MMTMRVGGNSDNDGGDDGCDSGDTDGDDGGGDGVPMVTSRGEVVCVCV